MQHLQLSACCRFVRPAPAAGSSSGQHISPESLFVPRRAAKQLHVAPHLQHQGAEVRQQDIHLMIRRQGAPELGQLRLFHTQLQKRPMPGWLITTKILQPGIDDRPATGRLKPGRAPDVDDANRFL